MTYKDIPGYCDFHDFYKRVFDKLPDGANIAEIGVFLGHSVAYMVSLAKEHGKDIEVFAIDTFEGSEEHKSKGITNFNDAFWYNMTFCRATPYITRVRADSISALDDDDVKNTDFDFVFIDAAHDYESVKADIAAWWPKVKPGGILAGHDYCEAWPGVKQAVDEAFPNRQLTSKSVWFTIKHGQTS